MTTNNLADNTSQTHTILETALSQATQPVAVLEGPELLITFANEAFLNLLGKDSGIIGKGIFCFVSEPENEAISKEIRQVFASGAAHANPAGRLHIFKAGGPVTLFLDYSLSPIAGHAGEVTGVLVLVKDSSEEVFAVAKNLTEDELTKPLDLALRTSGLGYYELDLKTGRVECTDAFREIFELAEGLPVSKEDLFKKILPEYHAYLEVLLSESIHKKGFYNTLYEITLSDGSTRWVRGSGYPRLDAYGERVSVVGVVTDVTREKIAEEKSATLAAIIDSSDDAIISKTLKGIITSWNKSAEKMFGYKEDEVVGKHISILIPTERLSEEDMILGKVKSGEKVDHFETWRKTKSGQLIPIMLTVSPIKNEKGEIVGASKIARDISAIREGEEKQAVLAAIVNSSDDAIVSKTLESIITSWNKAAERIFGYTAEEAIGKSITMLIPPDRIQEEDHILAAIRSGRRLDHMETIRVRKDGQLIPISLSISPIKNGRGEIIGASKIARDISEIKKAEANQAMLAAIVNTSDDAIISKSLQGRITSWNQAAERLFGYTAEEAVGQHISLLIPSYLLDEEEVIIENILKGRKVQHFETIRIAKNGRKIPVSLTVSPIQDTEGKIIGASKIARDISGKKESEEALERYARNLEIINSMAKTIAEKLDLHQILQKVSDATTDLIGAQAGAFFFKTVDEHGEPRMLHAFSGQGKVTYENDSFTNPAFSSTNIIRIDDITKDNRYKDNFTEFGNLEANRSVVSYLEVPMFSKAGTVSGYLVFSHSEPAKFTQEHENLIVGISLQASIALENAKLYEEVTSLNAKKDEFIGMASHELKTPLTSMTGYLQILERQQKDDLSRSFVSKSIEKAGKLTALVSDLLDISKIEAGKLQFNSEKFDIHFVVREAIELIQPSTSSHKIVFESLLDSYLLEGDKQRIEQVVINLLTNAIKYSPAADKVVISLAKTENGIKIGVRDFGIGIPRDKQSNIFSRFYRVEGLSPHMSGLGIGLYITREIVERHNGKIWVESEPGEGSTFWFTLPEKD